MAVVVLVAVVMVRILDLLLVLLVIDLLPVLVQSNRCLVVEPRDVRLFREDVVFDVLLVVLVLEELD